MNEKQDELVDQLWQTACDLLDALEGADEAAARAQLAPDSKADILCRLFGLRPLLILTYGHHEGGGYFPTFYQEMPKGRILFELARCRDAEHPQDTIEASFCLLMRLYRRRWRVEDIRPFSADEDYTPERLMEMLERKQGDPMVLGLVTGALQPKLLEEEELDEVEELVLEGMAESGFSALEQVNALRLWRDFKRKGEGYGRKMEAWAAALEYVIGVLNMRDVSQKSSGEAYGVSTSTVADRQKVIVDTLRIHQFDERYALFDSPFSELEELLRASGLKAPRIPFGAGRGKSYFG